MPISSARAAVVVGLLAGLAAAGCVAPAGGGGDGSRTAPARTPPATSMPVLAGAVTVAVPSGYCLDPKASHDSAGGALVIAGRCAADRPVPAAALTVSVGAEGSSEVLRSGARALTDWALSTRGRAALARDGRPGSVRVRETQVTDGAFLLRLDDRAVGSYWRAALGVKGHLIMIAVTPPDGGSLSPEEGRRLVLKAVSAVRRANAS